MRPHAILVLDTIEQTYAEHGVNLIQRIILTSAVICLALIAMYLSYLVVGAEKTFLGALAVAALLSASYAWPSKGMIQRNILAAAVSCLTLMAMYISHSTFGAEKTFLGGLVFLALLYPIYAWLDDRNARSKIDIGPGEKGLVGDRPSETTTVISGFDTSDRGQVSIRGETWQTVRAPDDSGSLPKGTAVQVVERKGLTLVVSVNTG